MDEPNDTVSIKRDPDTVKSMTFHFTTGRTLWVSLENCIFKLDAAGIFIQEPINKVTTIITPNMKYRTKKFIQMVNVEDIDFEYYGE